VTNASLSEGFSAPRNPICQNKGHESHGELILESIRRSGDEFKPSAPIRDEWYFAESWRCSAAVLTCCKRES
jgi:hypothetical protein